MGLRYYTGAEVPMEVSSETVPVVDFSAYSLERSEPEQTGLQKIVHEIHEALTTIGFVYLKNTGCPQHVIERAMVKSMAFFELEKETKLEYRRGDILPGTAFGYVDLEQEGPNTERPYKDLKEAFNHNSSERDQVSSYIERTPELKEMLEALDALHDTGSEVMMRVLRVIAMGLELDDPETFLKKHRTLHSSGYIRSLHYPPLNVEDIKDRQVRCGEHTDYGSVTLLFQDDKEGLEVRNVAGQWIKAAPIQGTILVNTGDLMQRWTSDKLIASEHRVMPPSSNSNDVTAGRQSIVIFGHPDMDEIIECLDGSSKYPPIGSGEYLYMRLGALY